MVKIIFYIIFLLTFFSCKENIPIEKEVESENLQLIVDNIAIPNIYYLDKEFTLTINAEGLKNSDQIILRNKAIDKQISFQIKEVNNSTITFSSSEEIISGKFEIFAKRNNDSKLLGETYIYKVFNAKIPNKSGISIKGSVYSNGKGLANVIVSDGENVAKTDENGVYYLASSKPHGYVFVSIPSNYEVQTINSVPQFFKPTAFDKNTAEIIDFELFPVNNEEHVVAFLADIHMANRNDDIAQFHNGLTKDINALATELKAQNKKFYAITLGDQTWDIYWYDNKYGLQEFKNLIKDFNFPIFHTIGNHDNDPYVPGDYLAEVPFRNIFGPTYYSFNIGKVHYVVLDNIQHTNAGASMGTIGNREYNATLTDNQLKWLKEDLATITDKSTPIVIAMHIPFYTSPNVNESYNYKLTNASAFASLLTNFPNVKIVSGHTHYNHRVIPSTGNITEYNIGAVSATWWWTGKSGYANNQICKDGSPGGYGILESIGKEQEFVYKGIGFPKNYQFRAYDLNTVYITPETHTPNANATYKSKVSNYAGEYGAKRNTNEVLLNIWGYNPNWKISIVEDGNPLPIQRVSKNDPLHIISYEMKRLNVNAEPTSSFVTSNTSHMFLAKANNPTSTLIITVEDEYGNTYKEDMIRPKAFSTAMK